MARKRAARVGVLLLVPSGVAACSVEHDVRPEVDPAPVVSAACPRSDDQFGVRSTQNPGGAIPAGFIPVGVIRCALTDRVEPAGKDHVSYHFEERVAPATTGILTALGLPDRADDDAVGPLNLPVPTYVMLADADQGAIHLRLPQGPCGDPRPEGATELRALSFTVRAEFAVRVKTPGPR